MRTDDRAFTPLQGVMVEDVGRDACHRRMLRIRTHLDVRAEIEAAKARRAELERAMALLCAEPQGRA
jgi:hypothetical protein